MNKSKTVLQDLAIALAVLALAVAAVFLWLHVTGRERGIPDTYVDPTVGTIPELPAEPEPVPQAEEEIVRYVVRQHTVVGGESFSLITGMHWDDMFLWPDLYVRNSMRSEDPDMIFPDEIVDIYNRLGRRDNFSPAEEQMILDAYIEVYKRFKAIGPEKNSSAWTLLWCGAKYNKNFLNLYSDQIDPEDRAAALRYIKEEGFLD